MNAPRLVSLPTRDESDQMTALIAENAQLTRAVEEYKRRETHLVRAISEMLDAPKLVSAAVVDKQWEVVMTDGTMWRLAKCARYTRDTTEYFEEWMPWKPVPGTRAAIRERLLDADAPRVA